MKLKWLLLIEFSSLPEQTLLVALCCLNNLRMRVAAATLPPALCSQGHMLAAVDFWLLTASGFLLPGYVWVLFSDGRCHSRNQCKPFKNSWIWCVSHLNLCILDFVLLRLKPQSIATLIPTFQANIPETTYNNRKIQTYWPEPINPSCY